MAESYRTTRGPRQRVVAYLGEVDAQGRLALRPGDGAYQQSLYAHILVCFLACVLWKTLARWCHAVGLGEELRKIFAELSQIRLVDVVLPTRDGLELRKRCVSRLTEHQAILLDGLGLSLPTHLEPVGL